MADPRTELADIIVPTAPDFAATASNLPMDWGAGLAIAAGIALAIWLWQRRRPARRLRRIASAAALRLDSVPVLAARLDAWARARYGLSRVQATLCPPALDPAAWADWTRRLLQLRFAPPQPDGYAELAALCETACAWDRHV